MDNKSADNKKVRSTQGVPARRTAIEVLISIEKEGAYATIALNAAFKRRQLSERDRAFVTALVQGVLRRKLELDDKIGALSSQPLEKMPLPLKNILRIALFQLEQMEDIPASAIVDTSCELAKALGHQGQVRFTNGLLRNYIRSKEKESAQTDVAKEAVDDAALSATALSLKFSVPEWLVQRWLNRHGQEETISLLKFAQSTPELTVRACQQAITVEGLEQVFANNDIRTRRGQLVDSCLMLETKKHQSPEKLPGYGEGLFTVQDEAAAFVSVVVDAQPGEFIVDLCAAPGGKSLHLGEMMENTGRVVAVDKSESRLNLLKQNRNRLGLTNIEIFATDGRTFSLDRQADKVLLDAPCSGTGVINRRSDLRYRKEPMDIQSLSELQRELLANAAKLVKPGGILVYSTCSIEPEENFDNIRWFLREFGDFEGDDISRFMPERFASELKSCWKGPACKTESEMTTPYMAQLLPSRHGVSGFFICRLKRKE